MHFLAISTPRTDKPSEARNDQRAFWDWIEPLVKSGTIKQIYTKLGRGAVVIFDAQSHEEMHKLLNQWAECVPATFEVHALLGKDHQESIARAGTSPMDL